jgi:DNA polymerase
VLCQTRTNVVFGVGNPEARLMFVGEGPGADEDRKGEPFVGRAGQLLDKMIVAMKFQRKDVYIANIVKCRPPENRNPLPDEVANCFPYLNQQIEIIDPDVIVALGLVAATNLLKIETKVSVKSLREKVHNLNGRPMVVTYHPAALLRSSKFKAPAWQDLQYVMKMLSGEISWKAEV